MSRWSPAGKIEGRAPRAKGGSGVAEEASVRCIPLDPKGMSEATHEGPRVGQGDRVADVVNTTNLVGCLFGPPQEDSQPPACPKWACGRWRSSPPAPPPTHTPPRGLLPPARPAWGSGRWWLSPLALTGLGPPYW
eukprot:gene7978-biopygen6093